ncbi:putative RNA-binding Zn-ribbon protein involved in translation (DUF1610 family) [Mucilaginibacter sp. SG564]|nr:putative RNA-binding Zn-ribbon protein involved in translation (DUF1610 family) [Mucilaginibacter sp. SG564]
MISKESFFQLNASRQWPAYEDPRPDELFSSWLTRIAHLHGLKVETFCKIYWKNLTFWNRDIDRFYYDKVSAVFLANSRITPDKLRNTFLSSYEGKLFELATYKTNQNWIIPLGIYHRTRSGYGQMYCPRCLYNDEQISKPYFRKSWRLSLSFACVDCGSWLSDRCPNCNSPVVFFRNEVGFKNILPDVNIARCYRCREKLSNEQINMPADKSIITLQTTLNRCLIAESPPIDFLVYPFQYLDILHHLIRLINSKSTLLAQLRHSLCELNKLEYWQPIGSYRDRFDTLPIGERMKLLLLAHYLLEDWPSRFINVVYPIKRLRSAWLLKDLTSKHYWFDYEVMFHFYITNSNR